VFPEVASTLLTGLAAGLELLVLALGLFWQAPTIKLRAKLVTAKVMLEKCLVIWYKICHFLNLS
jgi:hypothetical protein